MLTGAGGHCLLITVRIIQLVPRTPHVISPVHWTETKTLNNVFEYWKYDTSVVVVLHDFINIMHNIGTHNMNEHHDTIYHVYRYWFCKNHSIFVENAGECYKLVHSVKSNYGKKHLGSSKCHLLFNSMCWNEIYFWVSWLCDEGGRDGPSSVAFAFLDPSSLV